MATVFLSYSRADQTVVSQIAEHLEARLASVWWDRDLASNDRYIEMILDQIDEADEVVIVLSPTSRASPWVSFEAGAARARERAAGKNIIHLLSVDAEGPPDFLSGYQVTRIDSSHWNAGLATLCTSIGVPVDANFKPPSKSARVERSVEVFRAAGQWMELVASAEGIECVLVDSGERRARRQWAMTRERVETAVTGGGGVHTDSALEGQRAWGLFSLGNQHNWRWSPLLFQEDGRPPEDVFRERILTLARWVVDQPR